MPVSVRDGAAVRTLKCNVPELIVFLTAARAGILQLKGLIIVLDAPFALSYTSCHLDSLPTTIVLNGHVHRGSPAVILTFIATFI